MRDYFSRLEYGTMTVLEYDAQSHKLAEYATTILLIKYVQIWCFIQGLRHPLKMATQTLVVDGRYFIEVSNYAQTIENMNHET